MLLESVFDCRERTFRLKPIHEIGAAMYCCPSEDLLTQCALGNSVKHGKWTMRSRYSFMKCKDITLNRLWALAELQVMQMDSMNVLKLFDLLKPTEHVGKACFCITLYIFLICQIGGGCLFKSHLRLHFPLRMYVKSQLQHKSCEKWALPC